MARLDLLRDLEEAGVVRVEGGDGLLGDLDVLEDILDELVHGKAFRDVLAGLGHRHAHALEDISELHAWGQARDRVGDGLVDVGLGRLEAAAGRLGLEERGDDELLCHVRERLRRDLPGDHLDLVGRCALRAKHALHVGYRLAVCKLVAIDLNDHRLVRDLGIGGLRLVGLSAGVLAGRLGL